MPTRRDVVKFICAGSVLATGFSKISEAKIILSQKDGLPRKKNPFYSQIVLRPSDVTYDDRLEELFPGLNSEPIFRDKIYRSSSLIFNAGSRSVFGYGIKWRGKKSGQTSEVYRRLLLRMPDEAFKTSLGTFSSPLLKAGDVMLVSPFYEVSSRGYQWARSHGISNIQLSRNTATLKRAAGFVDRIDQMDEVKIKLDSVAFSNFVVGADSGPASNSIRNILNGEHDEAVKLLSLSIDGRGKIDVEKLILAASNSIKYQSEKDLSHLHAEYMYSRAQFAHRLLLLCAKGDALKILQVLKYSALRQRINIR